MHACAVHCKCGSGCKVIERDHHEKNSNKLHLVVVVVVCQLHYHLNLQLITAHQSLLKLELNLNKKNLFSVRSACSVRELHLHSTVKLTCVFHQSDK